MFDTMSRAARRKTGSGTKPSRYHPALVVLHWIKAVKPECAAAGSAALDELALATHYGLYVAVALIVVSGIVTAATAGLPAVIFGGSRESLPATFSELPPRIAHGVLAQVIVALVAAPAGRALSSAISKRSPAATDVVWPPPVVCGELVPIVLQADQAGLAAFVKSSRDTATTESHRARG
jgi:hypothetical protein